MPPQAASWTCSACSLAWVLRATAANTDANEANMVEAIGYPQNINSTYGLMDGSGSQLRRVLTDYDFNTEQGWLTYDQVYSIADNYVGLMSGGAWYHWVALRGRYGSDLWIANSAVGYMGVASVLTRADFQRLGPFSVVWIPGYL